MGSHTKHGGYVIDPKKVRIYVVPAQLSEFKVRMSSSSCWRDVKKLIFFANAAHTICDKKHGAAIWNGNVQEHTRAIEW